jgi:hypothetical protein
MIARVARLYSELGFPRIPTGVQPLMVSEFGMLVWGCAVSIFAGVALWSRRKRAVRTALAGLGFCSAYWAFVATVPLVLDLGYMQQYLQRRALAAGLGSGVMNLLWIPYLLFSARVKETYADSRGGPTRS